MPAKIPNVAPLATNLDSSSNGDLLGMKDLVAKDVYDSEGNFVAKLDEVVIDTRTGCIRLVVLSFKGIMGFGRSRFAIPWSALSPDSNRRRCVVDIPQMRLTAVRVPKDAPWLHCDDSGTRGRPSFAGGD